MLEEKIWPMLVYSSNPLDSPQHLFEIKWDGTRCIPFVKGDELWLQNRRVEDIACRYQELAELREGIRAKNAMLDGERIVLSRGKNSFKKLQQRERIVSPLKSKLLSQKPPATYIVFDILFLNGKRRTELPLPERKKLLQDIL